MMNFIKISLKKWGNICWLVALRYWADLVNFIENTTEPQFFFSNPFTPKLLCTQALGHTFTTKTARYHDATKITHYFSISWCFPWNFHQISSVPGSTNKIIFFHGIFPWYSQIQLSTMMLQMTRAISCKSVCFYQRLCVTASVCNMVPVSWKIKDRRGKKKQTPWITKTKKKTL